MNVRAYVPPGWNVIGEFQLLPGDPPLHIDDPDGSFELDVEWTDDAFVGGARVEEHEFSIRASAPTAIREWVIGTLALVQPKA